MVTPEICGDCALYERGNPWSGLCVAHAKDGRLYQTSPGRECQHDPSEFVPAIKVDEDPSAYIFDFRERRYARLKEINGKWYKEEVNGTWIEVF